MAIEYVRDHKVYVYERGGLTPVGELTKLNRVKWGRVRDNTSEAEIDMSDVGCTEKADLLNFIRSGRHEIVIFRNGKRVWEGPITRRGSVAGSSSFFARDVTHYTYRTVMHAAYNNAYPNTEYCTTRAKNIIVAEMTRKEAEEQAVNPDLPSYNVLPYLVEHHLPTDAKTSRSTAPFEKTVFEEYDSLAAKAGMDYTVLNRAIHLWDTSVALGYGPRVTETDFLGPINVTEYGMELATRGIATDGQGQAGIAGGVDPYFGLVELLTTAYDESDTSGPPPTAAELASQSLRNISGRNPVPVIINVPDNSSLNPAGVLSMDDLVPGVYIPVSVVVYGKRISQMQKLSAMNVTETPAGEVITVTLAPASDPDDVPEEP